jgi:hypothetical protein
MEGLVPMKERTVGKLTVMRGKDWRTGKPKLFIALGDDACRASMEESASGEPIVMFDMMAPYELRKQVTLHLDQLKALFILWR